MHERSQGSRALPVRTASRSALGAPTAEACPRGPAGKAGEHEAADRRGDQKRREDEHEVVGGRWVRHRETAILRELKDHRDHARDECQREQFLRGARLGLFDGCGRRRDHYAPSPRSERESQPDVQRAGHVQRLGETEPTQHQERAGERAQRRAENVRAIDPADRAAPIAVFAHEAADHEWQRSSHEDAGRKQDQDAAEDQRIAELVDVLDRDMEVTDEELSERSDDVVAGQPEQPDSQLDQRAGRNGASLRRNRYAPMPSPSRNVAVAIVRETLSPPKLSRTTRDHTTS